LNIYIEKKNEKNNENEEKAKIPKEKIKKSWDTFEKIIKEKKLNKIRLHDKHIIYDFFKENGDKSVIFDDGCFQLFKEDYEEKLERKKPTISL
jgi:hypothetical protein